MKLLAGLFGVFLCTVLLNADYGCKGVGVILVLYIFRNQKIMQAFFGCCFLNASWQAIPAFALLGLYNGKRGFIKGKAFKATPHKARLAAWRRICLHLYHQLCAVLP